MQGGRWDRETLNVAFHVITGIDRQPDGFTREDRTVKTKVDVVVEVGIKEAASFAGKQAKDRSLVNVKALGFPPFGRVGLKGNEVDLGRAKGDEDAVEQVGIDGVERVRVVPGVEGDRRHNVSFRTLFHGTAAVLCERLKRFYCMKA